MISKFMLAYVASLMEYVIFCVPMVTEEGTSWLGYMVFLMLGLAAVAFGCMQYVDTGFYICRVHNGYIIFIKTYVNQVRPH